MFNNKFTKLGEDIYVYKNFLSEDELKDISIHLESIPESEWYEENKDIKWILRTDNSKVLEPIRNKIVDLVDDDMTVGYNTVFIKMKKGHSWGIHQDDYEFRDVVEKSKQYKDGDPYDLIDMSVYGLVVYFNEFEGGSVFYPEQNIEYKPLPGDMVIHGSGFNCTHGVREVLSDVRYSYSNHISKKIKIPKG